VAHALGETSESGREAERPFAFCSQSDLESLGAAQACWSVVARKLERFYKPEEIPVWCARFPARERSLCTAKLTSVGGREELGF
jgi:hypothetical protein